MLPELLRTERLDIRVARPGDGRLFHAALRDSLAELTPWLSWVDPLPGEVACDERCSEVHSPWLSNEDLMCFFVERSSGLIAGGSGLHNCKW